MKTENKNVTKNELRELAPSVCDAGEKGLELYGKFIKASFKIRKRSLSRMTELIAKENHFDAKEFLIKLKSILLDKHIEMTVFSVLSKYNLISKSLTSKDFYRICKSEKIQICNQNIEFKKQTGKGIKTGCYFTHKDLSDESFIMLDERLKGKAMRKQQYHLLGYHFLHRNDGLKPLEALSTNGDTKKEEALYFAIMMLGKSY
jgi:hypothetical protein